jgi:DEAD/DEAH box helicase domain-containing protein
LPADVIEAIHRTGIERPWTHQTQAAQAAFEQRPVAITTGTASGKTLGYLMPILAATYGGPQATAACPDTNRQAVRSQLLAPRRPHTALYLAPTKALAHDQLHSCQQLGLARWHVTAIDGDTDRADREWAAEHAAYLLSNPDFLHYSMLPRHDRWATFLSRLRYLVIDEAHHYRGVFGSQVAAVIRRLRRLCAHYGAAPTVIITSATAAGPEQTVAQLTGCDRDRTVVIDQDTSPHGAVEIMLWQPAEHPATDTATLLAELVDDGKQTVAFVPARRMAERVAQQARRQSMGQHRIESYRGGYLAVDRRKLEAQLSDGSLRGVATTNALELGVDIAGLDAVIISGFPGTRVSVWQQAGRAGRSGQDAQVFLVAAQNPLDAYYFDHPELLFDQPVEPTVVHPGNPYVLGPQLAAAAQEQPLTSGDTQWFGPATADVADRLAGQGALRRRSNGWFWTRPDRAADAIELRGSGRQQTQIIEIGDGRVLGTVDDAATDGTVHPGAVYLHQGETFLVDELDHQTCEALVYPADPGYYTQPKTSNDIEISAERDNRPFGSGQLHFGDVNVFSQVIGYLRRDDRTGEVWDETPLQMPQRRLRTQAVWWTLDRQACRQVGLPAARLGAAAHAAEHTAIGLLGIYAPCDRWDIGGLSTNSHPDTAGQLTVFVHDGNAGGAGFAEQGYQKAAQWWAATLERLQSCPCLDGCPSCVVSPKCGNANQMLDKAAAIILLRTLLGMD